MSTYKHDANIITTSASSVPKSLIKEASKPFTNQSSFIVKRKDQESEKINANKQTLQVESAMSDEMPVKLETEMKGNKINDVSDCAWPKDSMVDKHTLFVYLTNEELLKLGVTLYKDSMYYYNRVPGKGNFMSLYNTKINYNRYSTYDFYLDYDSDTACTKFRWGHEFYQKIDTLVPIVIHISDEEKILWFTSHESLFAALPVRYAFLKDIYLTLKCIKRKSPKRQLVNYWSEKRNVVLDKINYLVLSKEEMRKVGINIFKDSLSIVDPTNSFKYLHGRKQIECGTYFNDDSTVPEIPDMFPVLITDIKGLNQNVFGSWAKKRQNTGSAAKEIFNTLIPVQLPFEDIFKGRKYSLVLWYYPSDNFLQALPDRYRDEIRREIGFITSGQKSGSTSCTYFEACKSTLSLNDLKVYPNPVSSTTTVEFNLPDEATGKISLVNISGNELKLLVSQTRFPQGSQIYHVDLSDVSPGIYLVSIITDKGFKTQRIVVSR
jgi:hypothetical protein